MKFSIFTTSLDIVSAIWHVLGLSPACREVINPRQFVGTCSSVPTMTLHHGRVDLNSNKI